MRKHPGTRPETYEGGSDLNHDTPLSTRHRYKRSDPSSRSQVAAAPSHVLFRADQDTPTLAQWIREWLPTMLTQLKPSTLRSYRRNLELHVIPALGKRPLSSIQPRDLTALYGRLAVDGAKRRPGGLAPATVRYIHAVLRKALADAVDAGVLDQNPAVRAKPPRVRPTTANQMRSWTAAQLSAFLSATRDHPLTLVFRLAAVTGMRRGEVLGLRWSDVDLDNGPSPCGKR